MSIFEERILLTRSDREREELLALADKFEAGTHKAVSTGYEEYGEAFQRERKMIVDALRLAAKPAAEAIPESATLGSSIDLLVGLSFKFVETLDPECKHRCYRECGCCGGTDKDRDHYKPDINKVAHVNDCPLARDLPILKAIGLASDARHRTSTTGEPKR